MKFLIVGLGSMGCRRARCLKALGHEDIYGFDVNKEFAMKAANEYGTNVTSKGRDMINWIEEYEFDGMFVCVPPTQKQIYIDIANAHKIPCFAEADVQTYKGSYYASRTLMFHPAIQTIKKTLESGLLGSIYTFNYHLGQHIRDWHKGADYTDYYAAQKKTGACREMFAFELSWLSWIFGGPEDAKGFIEKQLNDEQVSADDVYAGVVKFNHSLTTSWKDYHYLDNHVVGTILIDIVSRPIIRHLRVICENGTLTWDWTKNKIIIDEYSEDKDEIVTMTINVDPGKAAAGYDKSIGEQMYVDEVKDFLNNSLGNFPEEANVIKLLERMEE